MLRRLPTRSERPGGPHPTESFVDDHWFKKSSEPVLGHATHRRDVVSEPATPLARGQIDGPQL